MELLNELKKLLWDWAVLLLLTLRLELKKLLKEK